MKWKYFPLADNDPKAKGKVLENVSMGAFEHTLTKKLLSRFSDATGPMLLIAFDSLDAEAECLFDYGAYDGGKTLDEAAGKQSILQRDSPVGGLVQFLENYLRSRDNAVLFCERWTGTRTRLVNWPPDWPPLESQHLYFREEVYTVLKGEAASWDSIEFTVREGNSHWATGVCSLCKKVPRGHVPGVVSPTEDIASAEIPSEAFFDEIVANTAHIFTPALDGEGYLVWSPRR
jgi:hypothetical protein